MIQYNRQSDKIFTKLNLANCITFNRFKEYYISYRMNESTCTCMTKNAVAAINPNCRINGRTEIDKYPSFANGSFSIGRAMGSTLFVLVRSLRL